MKNIQITTKELMRCGIFTALIAIGAFLRIPIPVVPFTLQVLFVILSGLFLGKKGGAISTLSYLFLGLAGLPIFTKGGGIGYILQPTFGYIIGFCVGAYVTGAIAHKKANPSYKRLLLATFVGLFLIYAIGMIYFYTLSNFIIGSPIGINALFLYCFLMTIPGDLVCCIFGAILAKRLIPVLKPSVAF